MDFKPWGAALGLRPQKQHPTEKLDRGMALPKMSMFECPKPVNMLPHMAKGTLKM